MTTPRSSTSVAFVGPAVLVCALLLLAPAASAQGAMSAHVAAAQVDLAEGTQASSALARLVHLGVREGETPDTALLSLTISASSVTVEQYHESQYEVDGPASQVVPDPQSAQSDPSQPVAQATYATVTITVTAAQAAYVLNGFAAQPFAFSDNTTGSTLAPHGSTWLDKGGVSGGPPGTSGTGGAQVWTHAHVDTPQVVSAAPAAHSTVTATGDLVLELLGLDLQLTDATGAKVAIHTGITRTPTGAPGASRLDTDFARLRLTAASLAATTSSPGGIVEWSADKVAATAGSAMLSGASGWFDDAAGRHDVANGQVALQGGAQVVASADSDSRLTVDGAPAAAVPQAHSTARASAAPVAAAAAFLVAAMAGTALLLHRRRQRTPSQTEVEEALADGRYARAATIAQRILEARPGSEDAVIARAIALAKQGRPERVVAELTRHLGTRDPTDGVVHYLLGLAYLDLGQSDKGRAALEEAVRRTPSLLAEAAARLGSPPSPIHLPLPAQPLDLDGHAYA